MQAKDYLQYIAEKIHSTVFATVDSGGRPVTCAIDIMDCDENGLYFLTARGKHFYNLLKANENIAFTAMKGGDTLSRVAVSVQGKAKEIGPGRLPGLFQKNPYMEKIYPDVRSRGALTVFKICIGCKLCYSKCPQKCIDISAKPVIIQQEHCLHCGNCYEICPAGAVERR